LTTAEELDEKVASIVAIVEDSISQESILSELLLNNLDVQKTLDKLLSKKRKLKETAQQSLKWFKQPKIQSSSKAITLDEKNIAEHIPCLLVHNILPSSMADQLLLEFMEESKNWELLPVIIFQKQLQSSHTTAFYVNSEASERNYHYNGTKTETKRLFTPLMHEAADIIGKYVNRVYPPSKRSKIEIQGEWKPDIVVANHYAGAQEGVGAHSDKLTYIGPRPVIASLTLGATRTFRLKRIPKGDARAQNYDVLLRHNTLLVMLPPCQEEFKHEVPKVGSSLNSTLGTLIQHPIAGARRICLTYRMTRSGFADKVPSCECNTPSELRPVIKQEKTFGKYFYICGTGKCSFFQWLQSK
jgi:alkylated DNA repair dioxygenase AlkB